MSFIPAGLSSLGLELGLGLSSGPTVTSSSSRSGDNMFGHYTASPSVGAGDTVGGQPGVSWPVLVLAGVALYLIARR